MTSSGGRDAEPNGLTNWARQERLARRELLKGGFLLSAAAFGVSLTDLASAQDASGTSTTGGGSDIYGYSIEPAKKTGGTIISAVDSVLRNWSLATGGWPGMSETLIEINPQTYEPAALLAKSWESSPDSTEWTFHLQDGVTWHDGEPFTADDVKFSFEMHADPDNVAAATVDSLEFAQQVKTIEIVDPLTVKMTLNEPVVDFLLSTTFVTIMAKHILGDVKPADLLANPASTGSDPKAVVFTGPFKFKEYVQNSQMTLVRNDAYWGGKPNLDEWIIKEIADPSAQVVQLQTGDLDFAKSIDPASASQFDGTDVKIVDVPKTSFNMYYYQLDPKKSPFFQDKRVRQALLFAIDRDALKEAVYYGFGEVPNGLLPTKFWAANPKGITALYPYDPDKAKALLEEAGWVDSDGDGVREKDGVKLQPRMLSVTDLNASWAALPAVIQEYWRKVGVEMTPDLYSHDVYEQKITVEKAFDTAIRNGGPKPTGGVDFTFNYRCKPKPATGNRGAYCNDRVDELLVQIAGEADREKRIALLTELQNIVLDELPQAPIMRLSDAAAVNARAHNVYPNGINIGFNAETWWVES
jgi:peptide/nickel transport system substrate-binding protein